MQVPEKGIRSPSLPRLKKKIHKFLRRHARSSWPLQSTSSAINSGKVDLIDNLVVAEIVNYPPVEFWNGDPPGVKHCSNYVDYAPITLQRIENATVIGRCNFILIDGKAVHPDAYLPSRDRSPLEIYGRGGIKKNFTTLRMPCGLTQLEVDRAINLCDQTHNYAHWITEILPKAALLANSSQYADYEFLVDDGLEDNHFESIKAVCPFAKRFVKVPHFSKVHVKELVNISPPSYCPHQFRDFDAALRKGFQFRFSHAALNELRSRLRQHYALFENGRPRDIYIQRTQFIWTWNHRYIVNIDEIEGLIDDYHIEFINLGGMSIRQQAKIFMNARSIVTPTGAALANMIFAKPGCKIVVLAARYVGANYDYFHRIACALGHEISFVTGPQTKSKKNPMNSDYYIEIDDLKPALDYVKSVQPNSRLKATNGAYGENLLRGSKEAEFLLHEQDRRGPAQVDRLPSSADYG